MIKDITLGQFFPGNSIIHNMDPRAKILLSFMMIAVIFCASSAISFATAVLAVLALIIVSGISLRVIIKGMKPVVFILLFTAVIQIFLTRTGTLLVEYYFIKIYSDGIELAVKMMLRIILLISSTSILLSYTTSPIALTDGIEGLLSPLRRAGLDVHEFAMMMSIAMRFIPTIIEETDKIISAQKARGTDFSSGGLIKRAKAMIPVFVPLLISELRRAEELSCAMICRCYKGGEGRTKLKELKIYPKDIIIIIVSAVLLAIVILENIISSNMGLPI